MCGIIAVIRRPTDRPRPSASEVLGLLDAASDRLAQHEITFGPETLSEVANEVAAADALLRGVAGVSALLADREFFASVERHGEALSQRVAELEADLDRIGLSAIAVAGLAGLEAINAAMISLKDAVWAIAHDRMGAARAVDAFAGRDSGQAAQAAYLSIQQALAGLDRLEVRGRDSAGLHLLVREHGLDLAAPEVAGVIAERSLDPLFASMAMRSADGCLSFVYKASAEIGELGDNTAVLREAIANDELLRRALAAETVEVVVLGHTRWASVGIISQANAHPLNSDELRDDARAGEPSGHYVTAVLNGDVDNFADLTVGEGLRISSAITTDAKVIPTLVARHLVAGTEILEAFRRSVDVLEGSVAIAASSSEAPADLFLALRGSGQALYVGLADDAFIVASEPYGLVEETATYLRMDGETPADEDNANATRGQIIRLRGDAAGSISGIERMSYDSTKLPVAHDELAEAQITTRDIDRGGAPHFLLKEITESPGSFRKTLRGKLVEVDGELTVALPEDALPGVIRDDLRSGTITRVVVIGQGTAAVAGQSFALALRSAVGDNRLIVRSLLATELSGFELQADMSDTLVVAVSQSGTTTDTNRTVDLVRARGGRVVAIVNRRNSDLTDKADGVLYTSDGRDIEMSVASTKAFYAQIAAGFLLATAIADEVGPLAEYPRAEVLEALRVLPDQMATTLACRPALADAAQRFAPSRRYWAIVGNGANRIAAQEVRIKLSELCYKSIAWDSTEDKKHIDLSAEPMIVVCAAGLSGSTADDVAKEIAIYRAHKAAPIVIASEGQGRFSAALQVIQVPETHPSLAFVLSAMAGHLFGYEAALAIDAQARPLRAARAAIETMVSSPDSYEGIELLTLLNPLLQGPSALFFDGIRSGEYDGHLEASTAVRVASQFRYALAILPLESYQAEHGKVGTPSVIIEDLTASLTRAIEELTRPIDAIKHQAKTVTVGISRSDESLVQVPLVAEVLRTGVARDELSYRSLRALATLDSAVAEVVGFTRYRIEGRIDDEDHPASLIVIDRGGLSRGITSRTEGQPELRGTKHRVAFEQVVTAARGRSDGRTLVIIPEVKDGQCTGLTLMQVRFHEFLAPAAMRSVLQGYRSRFSAIKDAVTETEPTFREDLLGDITVVDLLTEPVNNLADRWRS